MIARLDAIRNTLAQMQVSLTDTFEEPLASHRHKSGFFAWIVLHAKRAIRKSTRFLLKPYAEKMYLFQRNTMQILELQLKAIDFLYTKQALHLPKLKTIQDVHNQHISELMKRRWEIYDSLEAQRFGDTVFACHVCSFELNTTKNDVIESKCVFYGGKLTRYKCTNCGAIVGPLKMMALSQEEFALDYDELYTVYAEGDTTEAEKYVFYQFEPEKDKTYLNYGCGAWSRSIQELREEGYNVYGYEPYANVRECDAPYIFTSREELAKMRFDGIMTSNVIEHLREPVKELEFMKSLLKDPSSIMIHATACYEYLYEFSRFHVTFFIDDSIHFLAARSNLEVYDRVDTTILGGPYISCKFRIKQ